MAKVTLIAYTPEPEKTVAAAAKLCYSAADIGTLMDGITDEKAAAFLDMLAGLGHQSPIEHASFTFGIEGVSRSLLAQITRHRIASFSVQSQRYVAENNFSYVTPPEIAADEEAAALFQEAMVSCGKYYDRIAQLLKDKYYPMFLQQGKSEKAAASAAEKKAIEDARFVLPNACDTKMVVTMNARSLLHFFELRCCNRAQWEIRDVARQMVALAYPVAPHLFAKAGPPCVSGACPEGKMTCGRAAEMREEYAKLKEMALHG